MRFESIRRAHIEIPDPDPEYRSFDKAKVEGMAESIATDGLIQYPVITPLAEKPGYFRVICGRHRVYAMAELLNWETIPCMVAEGLDADAQQAMQDAENIFRIGLSDEQLKKSLIRWQAAYDKRYPTASGRGAAQKRASAWMKFKAQANSNGLSEPARRDEAKPFSKILEDTLGVSRATAGRYARQAKYLTEEAVDVLNKAGVTEEQYNKAASLGGGDPLRHALNLIASGTNIDEAIRQAAKVNEGKQKRVDEQGGKSDAYDERVGERKPMSRTAEELTDEDWLRAHCDLSLRTLKRKGPYARDAILYRRIAIVLSRLRRSVNSHVQEAYSTTDGNGPFFDSLTRTIWACHPSRWLTCELCSGSGIEAQNPSVRCRKCLGSGYILTLEHISP
jgi:hypothetical protein